MLFSAFSIIEEFHSHDDPVDGIDKERLVDSVSVQRVVLSTVSNVVTPVTVSYFSDIYSSIVEPVLRTNCVIRPPRY